MLRDEASDAEMPVPEEAIPGIPKRISKSEINHLPLARFNGRIFLITTLPAAQQAVEQLSKFVILGFDTESRPSFRKGDNFLPSVVQFASEDTAWIFQLDRIGGLGSIRPLLENPDILKVGVALHDDIRRLKEIEDYEAAGFGEINTLSRRIGVENTGLRALVALFLGERISKGAQVTNWARHQLSQNQIHYAATDAWISRRLYVKLEHTLAAMPEAEGQKDRKSA